MMRHLFLAFFAVSSAAWGVPASMKADSSPLTEVRDNAAAEVECSSQPGRTLCRELRRFNSLLVDCTGTACYVLWDQQMETADDIADHYYDEVDLGATVSGQIGDYSRQLAQKLCRVRVTGDPYYVANLAVHYNRLLEVLKELQQGADLKSPYSCTFSVD